MTWRNISFHESEVMRELERMAVREGHFKLTPEEHVKLAAAEVTEKPSVDPTNDLFADICSLAHGLEQKGYHKQAEELMQCLAVFKEAETHLYHAIEETPEKFVEMAHEGDVRIAPSEGDLGVIETIKSTQEKLRKLVEKQPTGKLATAQAEGGLTKIDPDSPISAADVEDVKAKNAEFLASLSNFQKALGLSTEINQAFAFTTQNMMNPQVSDLYIKTVFDYGASRVKTQSKVRQPIEKRARLTKQANALSDHKAVLSLYYDFYGNGQPNPGGVSRVINRYTPLMNVDLYNRAIQWDRLLGIDTANRFFVGNSKRQLGANWAKENWIESPALANLLNHNPDSIWLVYLTRIAPGSFTKDDVSKNIQKVNEAAAIINQGMISYITKIDAIVESANNALNQKMLEYFTSIVNANPLKDNELSSYEDAKNAMMSIADIEQNLNDVGPGSAAFKFATDMAVLTGYKVDFKRFYDDDVKSKINALRQSMVKAMGGASGIVKDDADTKTALAIHNQIASIYRALIDKGYAAPDKNPEAYKTSVQNAKIGQAVVSNIQKAMKAGLPFCMLSESLSELLDEDIPDMKSFVAWSRGILQSVMQDAKNLGYDIQAETGKAVMKSVAPIVAPGPAGAVLSEVIK
jgi:hypothetical protein